MNVFVLVLFRLFSVVSGSQRVEFSRGEMAVLEHLSHCTWLFVMLFNFSVGFCRRGWDVLFMGIAFLGIHSRNEVCRFW